MKVCVLTHVYPGFQHDPMLPFIEFTSENIQKLGVNVTVLTPYHPQLFGGLYEGLSRCLNLPRNEEDPEVPWLAELISRMRKCGVDVSVFAPAYQGLKSHRQSGKSAWNFKR